LLFQKLLRKPCPIRQGKPVFIRLSVEPRDAASDHYWSGSQKTARDGV
jgi:hypothetical protein